MSELVFVPHAAPLLSGVLIGRRKRFFADVLLEGGERVVAHCVNTGRMEGLLTPGRRVFVSRARPGRKLAYTWELLELDTGLVGVNTIMANRLVRAVLEARVLRGFRRFSELSAEYPYGKSSRVDFRLATRSREHFIEVKNCHLVYPDGAAYFPDAASERAVRHLEELTRVVESGRSASVLFTVQRADARRVRPSDVHDPTFALAARHAARAGVSFRALAIRPTKRGYRVLAELPVDLAPYDEAPVRRYREALTRAP